MSARPIWRRFWPGLALGAVLFSPLPSLAGALDVGLTSASGKPVEDGAVVLEPVSGAMPKLHTTAAIEQKDREYVPYVRIVQTGTAVDFPNRDPVKHHVYSFSPAKTFEIKLYAGKPTKPVIFDKAGEVALGCNIHDWMEAYVLVVDSPYFAKSDEQGKAIVANVPPGRYRLRLWHPRQKSEVASREVEIGTGTTKLNLAIEVAPRIRKPKTPPEAESY